MTAREYDVYLPVCVRVKVNEHGDVVAIDWARVDWEGSPWEHPDVEPESVLWRVRQWAEIAVTEMLL
jgi:hypothetical protein